MDKMLQAAITSCEDRIKRLESAPNYYAGKRQRKRAIELEKIKISALQEKQQRENPQPLTLDELRKMNGQPVWGQSLINDKPGEWFIVRIVEMSATWFIACAGATQGFGDKDTYGESWLAYRRPPEKEDRNG